MRKFVLDTNCFIAASRNDNDADLLETFVQAAAPGLHLSTVVAAELRAGTTPILIAYSCREAGAVLISHNNRDLERIRRVFPFEFTRPYPDLS